MWKFPMLTIAAAAAFQFTVPAAQAEIAKCAPRSGMVDVLKTKYSEQQNGFGFVNQATVFELFVSKAGTWTMLATTTAGISCIIGAGTNWQGMVPPDPNVKSS